MWESLKYLLVTVFLCTIVTLTVLGRGHSQERSSFSRLREGQQVSLTEGVRLARGLVPVATYFSVDSGASLRRRAGTCRVEPVDGWKAGTRFCMPAEFERQQAILLASGRLAASFPELLTDIVSAVRGRVLLVMLVDSQEDQDLVHEALKDQHLTDDDVRTIPLGIDTQWIRDFGPLFVRDWKGRISIVDTFYDALDRPNDDVVPETLGKAIGIRVAHFPITLDGGNILSNGKGLFLATTTLLSENQAGGFDETLLRESLRSYLGCEHLVMLEPLAGERTGHVDMFATFTDSRTIVVASCDSETDPENASILDQNAASLAAIPAPYGPLRVVRIPMPSRGDGVWRTYNNVIFANSVLLMPTYRGVDLERERVAIRRFCEVLPNWEVVGIDASGIIQMDGALHCISMNIPADESK